MPEKHTKLLIRDAFLSTVFVFVCIAAFAFNPLNFHVFDIIGSSLSDIEITDIIYSGKNPKKSEIEAKISNDIVLINAAERSRRDIAFLLNKLNNEKPAVIGVDFIFEGPKNPSDDSLLKSSFSKIPNLVLASKFKDEEKNSGSSYVSTPVVLGVHTEGYANLRITSMEKTVRYFRTRDENNGKTVYPFSLEVVNKFQPEKAEIFKKRNRTYEMINYEGNINTIYHFNGNDIEAGNFPKGFLRNKIVLVGFYSSDCNANPILDDYFYTPLNEKIIGRKFPDTYGVTIQANIINMILKENYIYKTPAWLDWLFGFFICFLHNLVFLRHYVHKHLWYHFYAKIIQLVTAFVLIFICIYLFRAFHIKMNASPFIIPVLLTVDLLYFYDSLLKWMHKKFRTKTYLLTGPLHH